MVDDIPLHQLKLVYTSKDECNCPLIPVLLKLVKKTEKMMENSNSSFLVSARYGKRVIVNASFSSFSEMEKESFIEIIDYNFDSHTLLILGKQHPVNDVILHWLLIYAKKEISYILEIRNDSMTRLLKSTYPTVQLSKNQSLMDILRSIMSEIKNGTIFIVDSSRIIITGSSVSDLDAGIQALCDEWRNIS
jgi:hypothetical protein